MVFNLFGIDTRYRNVKLTNATIEGTTNLSGTITGTNTYSTSLAGKSDLAGTNIFTDTNTFNDDVDINSSTTIGSTLDFNNSNDDAISVAFDSNQKLNFYTGSSPTGNEKLTIDATNARIGINKVSPSSTLHSHNDGNNTGTAESVAKLTCGRNNGASGLGGTYDFQVNSTSGYSVNHTIADTGYSITTDTAIRNINLGVNSSTVATVKTEGVELTGYLGRTSNNSGMEGYYASADEALKPNPIYFMGSSFKPLDTSLGTAFYGIGYGRAGGTSGNANNHILTNDGAYGMYVASDGDARVFFAGNNGGESYINSGNLGIGISNATQKLQVAGVIAPSADNTYDLGTSSLRFDDVYATNSTIQTSDRNAKEDISGSKLGLNFINHLNPVSYKFKNKSRIHYGLVAQEVKQALESCGVKFNGNKTNDFGGYIYTDAKTETDIVKYKTVKVPKIIFKEDPSGNEIEKVEYIEEEVEKPNWKSELATESYGLRYSEFIAPIIKSIQELSEKIDKLQS